MNDEVPVMATPEYVISKELYNRLINRKMKEESDEDSYVLPSNKELEQIKDSVEERGLPPIAPKMIIGVGVLDNRRILTAEI